MAFNPVEAMEQARRDFEELKRSGRLCAVLKAKLADEEPTKAIRPRLEVITGGR